MDNVFEIFHYFRLLGGQLRFDLLLFISRANG